MTNIPFVARPDDVYIASYPRSGTSLLQMMLYQMTTGGELTFQHIDDVIPFFEKAQRSGRDLEALRSPRLFKTHLPHRVVFGRPGRFIYVSRCGKDVLLSYFQLYKSYVDPGLTFEAFFDSFLEGRVQYGSWFEHVSAWEGIRGDPRVLFLRFEAIVQDLKNAAREVADFLSIPLTAEQSGRVVEYCGISVMRQQEQKFEPNPDQAREPRPGSFIRQGQAGAWRNRFSPTQQARFDSVAGRFAARLAASC